MGFFNTDENKQSKGAVRLPDDFETPEPLTVEERAEALRENALQYIIELDDKDLETFIESARLIRDGRLKLGKVKTVDEKQAEKVAKANAVQSSDAPSPDETAEDELLADFLEDEPAKTNHLNDGK